MPYVASGAHALGVESLDFVAGIRHRIRPDGNATSIVRLGETEADVPGLRRYDDNYAAREVGPKC